MSTGNYKYLAGRRIIQSALLFLFFGANAFGWSILRGNLSAARLLDAVPLADPFAVLQNVSAGASVARDAVIGALVVGISYALVGGRLFCGWVCPVNILTDAANWLRRSFALDEWGQWKISRTTRYWVIGLSLTLSFVLGVAAFEWINPIGMLHRGIVYGMGLGWTFVTAVFLFDLFAVRNGFCGHVCPVGGFYAIIGRLGFLRVGYSMDKCTLCMKCLDICPERQVLDIVGKRSGPVLSGECINCGRCVEICSDSAIGFRNVYSKK